MANDLETLEKFQELVNARAMNTEGDNTIVSVNSTYLQGLIDEFGGKKYITSDEASSALPVSNFVTVISESGETYGIKLYPITSSTINSAFTADWKADAVAVILPPSVTLVDTHAFDGASKLRFINLENLLRYNSYAFANTPNLENVSLPKLNIRVAQGFPNSGVRNVYGHGAASGNQIALLGGYDFQNCRRLETARIRQTTFFINSFLNCVSLREITFEYLPLAGYQSSAFAGCTALERCNIPNIHQWWQNNWGNASNLFPSGKVSLYVNDELITGVTSPSGITSVPMWCFYSITNLKEIEITSNVTEIKQYAFSFCTSLEKVTIPSSVATYGSGILGNSTGLTSVTIDNTTTPIDSQNLTNNPNHAVGNGPGELSLSGTYTFNTNADFTKIRFKKITIGGNLTSSASTITARTFFEGSYVEDLRVGGDVQIYKPILPANSVLKFFECNGQIANAHASGVLLEPTNSIIVHLGYSGICCTPSQLATATVINNKITKIYVGDGSSQAGDQSVLDLYLADTDWAAYSSKLDLWYNYSGEYKD